VDLMLFSALLLKRYTLLEEPSVAAKKLSLVTKLSLLRF
jgi:hypothetical protein